VRSRIRYLNLIGILPSTGRRSFGAIEWKT
jgi:hypothetical protein